MSTLGVRFAALAACGVLLSGAAAQAAAIDYIFTGTGTGSLDGSAFDDAAFTVTMVSDTSTVTSGGGEFRNDVGTMTFVSGGLLGHNPLSCGHREHRESRVHGFRSGGRPFP